MTHGKDRTLRSIRWNALGTLATTTLQCVALVVLARLLPPEIFGTMALAMVFVGFGQLFGEKLLTDAMVQAPELDARTFSSLRLVLLAAGLAVFLVIALLAWPAAWFFSAPNLLAVMPATAGMFLLLPWGMPYHALLVRELHFGVLAFIQTTATVGRVVVAVLLAWQGFGIWSLVGGLLAEATLRTLLLLAKRPSLAPRAGTGFHWPAARPLLTFGLQRAGAQSLSVLARRMDKVIVGAAFGQAVLGYYTLAFNLVFQLVDNFTPILTAVALPVLARDKHQPERLRVGYLQLVGGLTRLLAPVQLGLAAVAPVAVPLLFGPVWIPAVPLVQLMAVYGLLDALARSNTSLLLACGRADRLLVWNLGAQSGLLLVQLAGVGFGPSGLLVALAAGQGVCLLLGFRLLALPLCQARPGTYARTLLPPLGLALVMGGVVTLAGTVLPWADRLPGLVLQILLGIGCYLGLMRLLLPNQFARLQELLLPLAPNRYQ